MRTIGLAAVAAAALACSPPAHMVRYQEDHQADWIAPDDLPGALRPPLPEARLLAGMGVPLSSRTWIAGATTFRHYVFCSHVRTFEAGDAGPLTYIFSYGGWHPVMSNYAGTCDIQGARQIRVTTANGRVAVVND